MHITAIGERLYPLLAGVATLCASIIFASQLADPRVSTVLKELYAALMNVSAIYTGFLCNLLFTLQLTSTTTLDKLRNTQSFQVYMGFVRSAFNLGFAAALVSVPMMAVKPVPTVTWHDWQSIAFSAWAAVMVWSLAAVLRVGQWYLWFRHHLH